MHQGRIYPIPHKNEKIINTIQSNIEKSRSLRYKISKNIISSLCPFKFDSDFESGNLDLVIQRSKNEFDLYMRVDTNTQGHTNWYYF